jgi:hypothetical protein
MTNKLKLMAVLAHLDDESLGNGNILAKYAAGGFKTYLVPCHRGLPAHNVSKLYYLCRCYNTGCYLVKRKQQNLKAHVGLMK